MKKAVLKTEKFLKKKLFLQRLKPTISYQLNFLNHADLKFFEIIMKD